MRPWRANEALTVSHSVTQCIRVDIYPHPGVKLLISEPIFLKEKIILWPSLMEE